MRLAAVFLVALVIPNCLGFRGFQRNGELVQEFRQTLQNVIRNQFTPKQGHEKAGSQLRGFSWNNCSKTAPIVDVNAVSISPDPLKFPGILTVSTKFNITKELNAPLKADVTWWKQRGATFVKIPCIAFFGSCTYDDVCELMELIEDQCPQQLIDMGIDCRCPLKSKAYGLKNASFQINSAFLPPGDYKIEAHLTNNDVEVVCLGLTLSVE